MIPARSRRLQTTRAVLAFAEFDLDIESLELFRGTTTVPLSPQPAKVLGLLARSAGGLVTHEQIRRLLWGEQVQVDVEQSVHSCIKVVRAALGDRASKPRFIRTLPRRGYRFLVAVDVVQRPLLPSGFSSAVSSADPAPATPPPGSSIAGLTHGIGRWPAGDRAAEPRLLRVSPFLAIGTDPEVDEVRDALASELLASLGLALSPELTVVEDAAGGPAPSAGWTLRGSVFRTSVTYCITARLVQTGAGRVVWAGRYEIAADADAGSAAEQIRRAVATVLDQDPGANTGTPPG